MSFYDEASWLLIPEGIEEDIVFAQKPTNGLGDLTFTRASDATRTNSAGVIERTPWNLLTWSEMFSDVAWTKSNATITANTTTAPNGTLTADRLTADGTNGFHQAAHSASPISGVVYTWSIYAKKNTNNFVQLTPSGAIFGTNVWANFDLNNGTVGSIGSAATASIQSVGDGWYRCTVTGSATATATGTVAALIVTSSTAARGELNTLTTNLFLWGAQLVEGTDAKPYFATTNRQDVPRLDYRNADGSLNSCPRLLLEPQRTNSIRNSTMVGAVAGTPGTLPTNWVNTQLVGLSRQISLGTENGLSYIDLRFFGTGNANDNLRIDLEGTTQIAAANGQTWAYSLYAKAISGTIPSAAFIFLERNIVGSSVTVGGSNFTPTSTLTRFNSIRTLNGGATVAFVQPSLFFAIVNGATYDFTIRIAAPQMELGATASTFIPTTTAAVTRIGEDANRTGASAIIGQTEGTVFYDVIYSGSSTSTSIMSVRGLTKSLNVSLSGNLIRLVVNGVSDALLASPNTSLGVKMAIAYNNTGVVLFANGVQINLPNTGAEIVNDLDVLQFRSITQLNSLLINQAALFKTRLTNAQLAQLTTL
jgi:hypothetical protein